VREWYENGQLSYELFSKNNKPYGSQARWWSNGQKRTEFTTDADAVTIGLSSKWHENGQMRAKYSCKDGVPDGEAISWGEDGEEYVGGFENGTGFLITTHENLNNTNLAVTFADGIQVSMIRYDKNGTMILESKYVDGKPKTNRWTKDGKLEKVSDGIERTLCVNAY